MSIDLIKAIQILEQTVKEIKEKDEPVKDLDGKLDVVITIDELSKHQEVMDQLKNHKIVLRDLFTEQRKKRSRRIAIVLGIVASISTLAFGLVTFLMDVKVINKPT